MYARFFPSLFIIIFHSGTKSMDSALKVLEYFISNNFVIMRLTKKIIIDAAKYFVAPVKEYTKYN